MNMEQYIEHWKQEEAIAHIHGWDFSHIEGRYMEEESLPWDYRQAILKRLTPEMRLLDVDTGGGEFLLALGHPHKNTSATEAYKPNVALCEQVLTPLGVTFREADGKGALPFEDASFDMVINRHGDFNAQDLYRVLRPGGVFITQQVGALNDRELVELLLGPTELSFPDQHLSVAVRRFEDAGFDILEQQECFGSIRFTDVGALVWFARIIEWEFPGFSVERCLPTLIKAQEMLDKTGVIEGRTHRFFLIARKN